MTCQKFVHTDEPDMDWVCVCGHDADWHNYGPSRPGGPCEACELAARMLADDLANGILPEGYAGPAHGDPS